MKIFGIYNTDTSSLPKNNLKLNRSTSEVLDDIVNLYCVDAWKTEQVLELLVTKINKKCEELNFPMRLNASGKAGVKPEHLIKSDLIHDKGVL